jgi:hypothetical protein
VFVEPENRSNDRLGLSWFGANRMWQHQAAADNSPSSRGGYRLRLLGPILSLLNGFPFMNAQGIVRQFLDAERQMDFDLLRRIPSASVIKLVDYFRGLALKDQDALLDLLAQLGVLSLLPSRENFDAMRSLMNADPDWLRYRNAVSSGPLAMGLRYTGLRMRKAMLADPQTVEVMTQKRTLLDYVPRDDPPTELVHDISPESIRPTKTPLLHKLLDSELRQRLAPLDASWKQKAPGGVTTFSGQIDGTPVKIQIDLGGMGDLQLRYSVSIPPTEPGPNGRIHIMRFAYEQLWGAAHGWDYLTEENAEVSIRLLGDLIGELVQLRNASVTDQGIT